MGEAVCEVSDRRNEGMVGAGKEMRTARGLRLGDPALQGESILCREVVEDLVDATPFSIPRSAHQAPELPWACCYRVAWPGWVDRREKGE